MRLIGMLTGGVVPCIGTRNWSESIEIVRCRIRSGSFSVKSLTFMAFFLYASVCVYGAILNGYAALVADRFASAGLFLERNSGFTLRYVDIVGDFNGDIDAYRSEVISALDVKFGSSIFHVDPQAVCNRLSDYVWFDQVSVERLLPDGVRVKFSERQPFAIWQYHGKLSLVDRSGSVITDSIDGRFLNLPVFVGYGANRRVSRFIEELEKYPGLRHRISAFVRVADRRWNLHLKNDAIIKLPELSPWSALSEIALLEETYGLLGRDFVLFDFRLPDRIGLRLSPESATRYRRALKERRSKRLRERNT
ncbi:MAG: cell division protein FtsQ/DivIB [Alphaproteobacteria bacterium]|nr:cell division protein FtsQ/DivIB [Alphaproteobacteria bacterium]